MKFLPPWTEDDFSIIKEKWLLGWTDDKIARLFEPPRTPKGVQGQRLRYKLTAANYPDRPNPKKNGSQYNDADILRRHHAGELPKYKKAVAVLSGGNVDPVLLAEVLTETGN